MARAYARGFYIFIIYKNCKSLGQLWQRVYNEGAQRDFFAISMSLFLGEPYNLLANSNIIWRKKMKGSRRFLLVLTCILVAMSCFAGVFACSTPCEHTWGEWATVTPAGCETSGTEQRECPLCQETETRPIQATGKTTPNADYIIKLSAYFGVSSDYLLGITDN